MSKNAEWLMRNLIVGCVLLPAFAAFAAPRMDRSKLQIGTYCLASYARTDEQVKAVKDCGVDFIYGIPASDRATLDLCSKHGLGVIATGAVPFWHGSNDTGKMREQRPLAAYEKAMAKYADHPAVWMIDYVDEASAVDFPHIGEVTDYLKENVPEGVGLYANLYPNYASVIGNSSDRTRSQLGTATYAEHVAEFVRLVRLDYLSFDFYPYSAVGTERPSKLNEFHENFRIIAEACRRYGKSLWYIPQVNSVFPDKWTTENQLRFQANLGLAYGAEVITWSCWSREEVDEPKETDGLIGWWFNNVLTLKGEKTEQYAKLQKVNAELRRLGGPYMKYRNVGTRFVGRDRAFTVGDMVSRDGVGKTAMFVLASSDPFDEHPGRQRFTFYAARARATGGSGEIPLEDCGNGLYAVTLDTNAGVLIEYEKLVAPSRVDRSRFLIGAYTFHNGYLRSEKCVKELKDCGLDFVWGVPLVWPDVIDNLGKHGLGAIVEGAVEGLGRHDDLAFSERDLHPPEEFVNDLARRAEVLNKPAVWRLCLCDEPGAKQMRYIGEISALIADRCPGRSAYTCLYPNYASAAENTADETKSQLQVSTYREYVDVYCRDVPADYICYDHYMMFDDPKTTVERTKKMYDNYEVVADACRRTGRDFWYVPQVNSRPESQRKLRVNELRYQAFTAMAFGAVSISWACWSKGWWKHNVYGTDGKRDDEQYEKLKTVNFEMRRFAPYYMKFRNVATEYVGFPGRGKASYGDDCFSDVRATDGSQLLVGVMDPRQPGEAKKALLLVAADDPADVKGMTHTVTFKAKGSVAAIGPDGKVAVERGEDGTCSVTLRDNSCAFVVAR